MDSDVLIIAYGNCLRGDDGIGLAVADIVRSWQTPGVAVLTAQQLVPEIIEKMTKARCVLFVDAVHNSVDAWTSHIVEPRRTASALGHHETPANLLALLRDLYGKAPQAWLLTISGSSFGHGDHKSVTARDNMQSALTWIRRWLAEWTCTTAA